MHTFDFIGKYSKLLTNDIVALLAAIHEQKGKQTLAAVEIGDVLEQLIKISKIQSTEASNRIEGVVTTDERLKKLLLNKTIPQTRSEKEIAGYRDVLATIHDSHDYIPPRPSILLQLHRDLFKFSGPSSGGTFKNSDNIITESLPDGTKRIRFEPTPAWETPEAIDALCASFEEAIAMPELDPLLLITMFVFDFLCIHPFRDGNGRMSRLLTLLLLYRADYTVGKYISLEKLISDSKDSYYEALQDSSFGWHENKNDYAPFVRYLLGIILAAYRELDARLTLVQTKKMAKPERIREVIRQHLGKITKAEIMAQCPDISQVTVQRTLAQLIANNEILKLGGGRYTAYTWNRENEL